MESDETQEETKTETVWSRDVSTTSGQVIVKRPPYIPERTNPEVFKLSVK